MSGTDAKRGSLARIMGSLYVQGVMDAERNRPPFSALAYALTATEREAYSLGYAPHQKGGPIGIEARSYQPYGRDGNLPS